MQLNQSTVDIPDEENQAETEPLLAHDGGERQGRPLAAIPTVTKIDTHGITDNMMYHTRALTTWETFLMERSIWVCPDLWSMMARLALVCVATCIFTVLVVSDPISMKVSKFTEVSKFLNVVVGLLLGFFLSSSMNRWYSCVNGFLELLDAIRNLQMQFVALGVPEEHSILCLRYSFASAWLLFLQLQSETQRLSDARDGADPARALAARKADMWRQLTSKPAMIDGTESTMLLTSGEADDLKSTRDPPGMMWIWVAALMGRLAQDGFIPPMASPTYGRIMNLCQSAHAGIRQVRAAISVQAPFTYTHMLASLVHINNLLNACCLGIVAGLSLGTALSGTSLYKHLPLHNHVPASPHQIAQDWQNTVVTLLYCFFGPMIYQALLLIGMHLAQPFDSEYASIPFDRLLCNLEVDLCNGRDLVEKMAIEKPCFKVPTPTVGV